MVHISKIEAAQRQLDTSIELYLHEHDLLSVHTLAWAAFSILVSYDEATNAGGVWAKQIREHPCENTRKLANFLKHADRDPLNELGDLTDEYTHNLLLEGCKRFFELTDSRTRPIDVFYGYDIFLDAEAQDRELDRKDRSGEVPTEEETREEERLHFLTKAGLLEVAREALIAPETTWSDCPPREYSVRNHEPPQLPIFYYFHCVRRALANLKASLAVSVVESSRSPVLYLAHSMKVMSRTYTLSIEQHDGGYIAYFPALPGCHTWGKTYEAAVRNAEEALELYLETLAAHGDPAPDDQTINAPVSLGVTVRTPVIS